MTILKHKGFINIRMLLRVIGWLLLIESAFMAVPLITALCFREECFLRFLMCAGFTALCGSMLMSLKPKTREMGKREAILLTAFTWVILSLFGMLPFIFTCTSLNVTDAFFETMSGFTTTGASVFDSIDAVPRALVIWRCTIQWIGGLGIILFTLAVLPMLNYQGGMQLFNAEVTGITHDKLRPRVSFTAQSLWLVYIALTTVLILLLSLSELDWFNAICYGLSTMSTGGFSISDQPITASGSLYIKSVLLVFMFLGGVNFALLYKLVLGQVKSAWKNEALRWYVGIILVCYTMLCCNLLLRGLGHGVADFTIDPLFLAVSFLSSTGITIPGFDDWGSVSTVVLILMMFMGACAGSTSGGAKIDRFIVLFKFIKNEFYKMMHPNAVTTVVVSGKGTQPAIVMKALAFLFLYVFVIALGGAVLVIIGLPLKDSFFLALSAVSNTGMGTDITGVSGNFSLLPDTAKWLLSFIMLTGRLELYTVLLLFTPTFWKN